MGERDVLNEGEIALLDLVEADIRRADEGPGGSKLLLRDIVQLAGIARRLVSEVERLRTESEAAFACIECDGEGAVDEDGCCVTCGADCFVLRGTPDERASTRDLIGTVVSAARCAAAGDVERLRARNEALPLLPKDSSDAAQEQARLMIEAAAARGKASAGGDGKVDYAYAFGWLSQDLTNTLIDMAALRARNEALERVAKAVAEITHKMYQDREARGWCQDYYNALSALAEPGKGGAP